MTEILEALGIDPAATPLDTLASPSHDGLMLVAAYAMQEHDDYE